MFFLKFVQTLDDHFILFQGAFNQISIAWWDGYGPVNNLERKKYLGWRATMAFRKFDLESFWTEFQNHFNRGEIDKNKGWEITVKHSPVRKEIVSDVT